jgi:dynein heavy chain
MVVGPVALSMYVTGCPHNQSLVTILTILAHTYSQIWEDLLDQTTPWVGKVFQLHHVCANFQGVVLTGPTVCGKTTMISTLCRALSAAGNKHAVVTLHARAMSAQQLFGWMDVHTNEWREGVLPTVWRTHVGKKAGLNTWMILDGPMDAEWADTLNTAMDENRTLTLSNGDRSLHTTCACRHKTRDPLS